MPFQKKKKKLYSNKKVDIIYPILLVREGNIFLVLNGSSVNLELDIKGQQTMYRTQAIASLALQQPICEVYPY